MLVFASEAITSWRSLARSHPPDQSPAHSARRGRVPGARRSAPGAALGARPRALPRRVVATGWNAQPGRDARGVDPASPRHEGRRARGRPPRAARNLERPGPPPGALGARDGLPRPRAAGDRSASAARHELASGRRSAADRVRPRSDRPRGTRATAREALLLEHRLRARAGDVHARRAPRRVRSCARLRRLGDEPQADPASPRCDRARPASGARTARPAGVRPRSSASTRASSRSPIRSRFCARRRREAYLWPDCGYQVVRKLDLPCKSTDRGTMRHPTAGSSYSASSASSPRPSPRLRSSGADPLGALSRPRREAAR